jgi:hypothetical protein
MVNLSRIDKNVYKSLGFKNKSIGQTMIKEVLQTKVTNFKTIPALVQHIKPKISNLINMGFDVNDKKMYKQLKSIKNISKKIEKLDINNKDAEKIISKLEQEIKYYDENKNKRWNVTGIIKCKQVFTRNEEFGRIKEYVYYQDFTDSGSYQGTRESLIQQFKDTMTEKYNKVEPSPEIEWIVVEVIITSIVEKELTTILKEDNAMKNATPLMYNCISEYRDFLQNTGTCVVDNFIGMYGPKLDKYISYFLESSESNTQNR